MAKPSPVQDALGSGAAGTPSPSWRRLGGRAGLCMRKVSQVGCWPWAAPRGEHGPGGQSILTPPPRGAGGQAGRQSRPAPQGGTAAPASPADQPSRHLPVAESLGGRGGVGEETRGQARRPQADTVQQDHECELGTAAPKKKVHLLAVCLGTEIALIGLIHFHKLFPSSSKLFTTGRIFYSPSVVGSRQMLSPLQVPVLMSSELWP